jgi:hypothetical protein
MDVPKSAMSTEIPREFAVLVPFVRQWALPSEGERDAVRLASSTEEIMAFCDALQPVGEAAAAYLDKRGSNVDERDTTLVRLLYALVSASDADELGNQPRVTPTGI